MGKNTTNRARPLGTPQQTAAAFFGAGKTRAQTPPVEASPTKMAPTVEGTQERVESMGREEFREELIQGLDRIESQLASKITALIAPLSAQIQELQSTITQAVQTADTAMELALTNQESTRALQRQADWAADKILFLENQQKMRNLKLRGCPEGVGDSTDLRDYISSWLAEQMELEDGVIPLLDAAYRLGPSKRAKSALPRDILICCSDLRTKQGILTFAREKGYLQLQDSKVTVLQDLSAETLEARCRLKPLTSLLATRKIRYRWAAYTKVQVVHKGVPILADDLVSGSQMLQALNIEVPSEFAAAESQSQEASWNPA